MADTNKHGVTGDDRERERTSQEAQATPTKGTTPAKGTTRKGKKTTTKGVRESEVKGTEASGEQVARQPVAHQPPTAEPAAQQPIANQPIVEQAIVQEPTPRQPTSRQDDSQAPAARPAARRRPASPRQAGRRARGQAGSEPELGAQGPGPQDAIVEKPTPAPQIPEQPVAPVGHQAEAAVERIVYNETSESASHSGNGSASFAAQWEAAVVDPIRVVILASVDDSARDMHLLRDALSRLSDTALPPSAAGVSSTGTVDRTLRIPREIWPSSVASWSSKKRATLAAALVLTAPATPTPLGERGLVEEEWLRSQEPAQWGATDATAGIRRMYQDLIRMRHDESRKTRGLRGQQVRVHHVNDWDKVIAFHRWESGGPGDDVIVVVNAANRAYESYTIGLPRGGVWRVRFNSDWEGYSPDFGNHFSYDTTATPGAKDGFAFHGNVGLGPYSVVILSQD
jgi:hypothetical protein